MQNNRLPLLAALLGLALMPAAAQAAESYDLKDGKIWKPYSVVKDCTDGRYHCRARMTETGGPPHGGVQASRF